MQTHSTSQLQYLRCNKQGLHSDEYLNMVCLETSCLQNLICCCACVESEHKKHITKPLKMVINQARSHTTTVKTTKFDIDVMLDIINNNKKNAYELFQQYKQEIAVNLDTIQLALHGYYNSTIEQIIVKSTDSNLMIEEAIARAGTSKSVEQLKLILKKLVAIIPSKTENYVQTTESQVIDSLNEESENIKRSISSSMEQVITKLNQYQNNMQGLINNMNIWKPTQFKFSPSAKHTDIKLISDYCIKSVNNSGYKFAIMDPTLEKGVSKTFAFRIKECSSNWLAIGMCHKKIVESKNFGFNFGSIGHGGYMISCNGGSWSHIKTELNNSIKSFKYAKNDVVTMTVNLQTKKLLFKKKGQNFELPFEMIGDDKLHLCVLFYYINDEVEFLPNYKE